MYIQNTWEIMRRWDYQLAHLHIHIDSSRNVSLKITTKKKKKKKKKNQNVIFSLFFPIYINYSLFYLKCFTPSIQLKPKPDCLSN